MRLFRSILRWSTRAEEDAEGSLSVVEGGFEVGSDASGLISNMVFSF